MKIYHHNDLDGRCAGAIAWRWGKKQIATINGEKFETIEVDYKDKIDINAIAPNERVIIVDFSFKPEVMEEILKITPFVTWIDHHKTAKDYPYQNLDGYRDFTDRGHSGCELAWMYFYEHSNLPKSVVLIGDYDKWALDFQPECFQFYEGLKMEVTIPQSAIWDHLFSDLITGQIIEQGKSVIRYRDNYCEKICQDFGYQVEWEGHRAFATNFYQFGSQGFSDRMEQYDFCIAYIHDGKRFSVSLYSVKDVDVSQICKRHGGGGHRRAAGFVCETLPFNKAY